MPDIVKVSATSLTTAVAGAIAGIIRDHGSAAVQAIGASAVNQAVKAIAIARSYLDEEGTVIVCIPHFVEVDISGQERTAIRFDVTVASSTNNGVSPRRRSTRAPRLDDEAAPQAHAEHDEAMGSEAVEPSDEF